MPAEYVLIIVIGVVVASLVAFLGIFAANYMKAEPNEALIFTGRKRRGEGGKGYIIVIGGAKFRIPVLEVVNRICLDTMSLPEVKVINAYSKEGVPVTIEAVANVKISSKPGIIDRAVERFLGSDHDRIKQIIKETLEGQLRDIVGVLTVEELYQKRDMFVNKVLDQAGEELEKIGVEIDIINIQNISDTQGYLEALGVKRTEEVKKDAAIGRAEAQKDAMIQSETARREGEVVRSGQEKMIAEAEKDRDVAKQQYQGEKLAAQKKAEQRGPLAEAEARKAVVIAEQKVLEGEQIARAEVESAKAKAEEARLRAIIVVPAEANKAAAIAEAEGKKQAAILEAQGQAEAILAVAKAKAEGTELQLKAEADGLKEKAAAWNSYGEAAKIDLVLEAMKVVAGHSAKALSSIGFDKIVAVDMGGNGETGGAISRALGALPGGMTQFSEQMKALLGIDVNELLKKAEEQKSLDPVLSDVDESKKDTF